MPHNNLTNDRADELFLRYTFTVDEGQEPLRVDKYLVNKIERATRNKLQEAIDRKQVVISGKAVKSNYKVKPGDVIEVLVDKEPSELEVLAEDIPLDIAYEDDDLMLVNKKAGMVVKTVTNTSGNTAYKVVARDVTGSRATIFAV